MVTWLNTPFADVIKAAENIYGEINCNIQINPALYLEEKAYGATTFTDEGNVIIELDGNTSVVNLIEILAHELAHVVTPDDVEHGQRWEKAFDSIFKEYKRYCKEKYNVGKENYMYKIIEPNGDVDLDNITWEVLRECLIETLTSRNATHEDREKIEMELLKLKSKEDYTVYFEDKEVFTVVRM